MKKIIALILVLSSLFLLVSCGDEESYKPVESSAIEKTAVMSLSIEGTAYDVKYELYRALFLNLKSEVDGGDSTVWTGENRDYYINQIDTLIKRNVADIYGTIHAAKKVGININSKKFNNEVEKYIKTSVNGGEYGGVYFEGFGKDYSKYLASLKELNLNYSVQDLLLRYALAREEIYKYYAGSYNEDYAENAAIGKLEFTKEDVKAFYNSDECVRVVRAVLMKSSYTEERAKEIRETFVGMAKINDSSVSRYAIQVSPPNIASSTFFDGEIIAKHNLDPITNEDVVSAAFLLNYFTVSELLEFSTADGESYYAILYRFLKTDEHFEKCYGTIADVYINNEIGKIVDGYSELLYNNATPTAFLESLNRADISMDYVGG